MSPKQTPIPLITPKPSRNSQGLVVANARNSEPAQTNAEPIKYVERMPKPHDGNRNERGGNADEKIEQSETEAVGAAAHDDVLEHVRIDDGADVKRKSEVQEIHRGKRADQLPAVERATV